MGAGLLPRSKNRHVRLRRRVVACGAEAGVCGGLKFRASEPRYVLLLRYNINTTIHFVVRYTCGPPVVVYCNTGVNTGTALCYLLLVLLLMYED